jgi:predicted ATPase with chaperone activity
MAVYLTDDQQKALDAVISGHNIIILGQAGTGKSFAIREAVRLLTEEGKTVSVTVFSL